MGYNYAELENICSMCFLYGPGIPIVFPLGLISLTLTYFIEKISLARLFRKPPEYSLSLTYSCTKNILLTPLLYSMFGFWVFTNKQVFDNDITGGIYTNFDPIRYKHKIITSLISNTPGMPLLLYSLFHFIWFIIQV